MLMTNKVALVTGAGSGIGRATAVLMAKAGARVAVNDLDIAKCAETLALMGEAGVKCISVLGDVSAAAEAERIVGETVKIFGCLDILVNNAGIIVPGRVDNTAEEDFDRVMRVNVKGAFLMAKYAVLSMRGKGGGTIVNVASVAALKGIADRGVYSASKGALVSLSRAMAMDYIKNGIRVNCVCPGTTDTPALEERMRDLPDPEAARAAFIARQPMGRLGRDDEIAQAILFACCDEAAYMTGSVITIDGGAML